MDVKGKSLVNWLIRAQWGKLQEYSRVTDDEGFYLKDESGCYIREKSYNNMPQSLCTYFWTALVSIVISIPTFPFLIWSYIVNPENKKPDAIPVVVSLMFVAIGWTLGASVFMDITGLSIWSAYALLISYAAGTVGLCSIIGLFGLIVYGIILTWEKSKSKYQNWKYDSEHERIKSNAKPNWFISFFRAKKAKMCPVINYTED